MFDTHPAQSRTVPHGAPRGTVRSGPSKEGGPLVRTVVSALGKPHGRAVSR
jgi:hypothetical protein